LRPADVIGIALSPERQDQQNVHKLRSLTQDKWEKLVNLIDQNRHETSEKEISEILGLGPAQQVEALAARSNMVRIVTALHDRSSQLMDLLLYALAAGKLCVVDVSQMRGSQSLILSGLILRRIFDRNQEEFTKANPQTIPTIVVVEEAQTVLTDKSSTSEPYVAWVKEGRKYDLGAVLVTQQPGSIPTEILSQGDNWFIFHLLSAVDLARVKQANSHFSDDLLSSLLNEPIRGQGIFWSSASGKPYPTSIRVLSFENMFRCLDPEYNRPGIETYASSLRSQFDTNGQRRVSGKSTRIEPLISSNGGRHHGLAQLELDVDESPDDFEPVDLIPRDRLETMRDDAIAAFKADQSIQSLLRGNGVAWGRLIAFFESVLPKGLDGLSEQARKLVALSLTETFGPEDQGWHTFKHPHSGKTWVKAGPVGD
jgi:uncharacterized protein